MATIQIKIQRKIFRSGRDDNPVIADLEISLASGEFVCLVGPSGCGKTTLLNIIAGLDDDFDGEIINAQAHATPKIGYVFQNPRLLPWRTVRENLELVTHESQAPELIDTLLETMQLTEFQHSYPERLSLGMCRRVAIIRGFIVNPDILLMDEPFVSLDAPTARLVRKQLIQLWQQRPHSVLFVTHDLREAIALADRIVFLSATPMHVLGEVTVPISRNNRDAESEIEQFRQQLLNHNPEINRLL